MAFSTLALEPLARGAFSIGRGRFSDLGETLQGYRLLWSALTVERGRV